MFKHVTKYNITETVYLIHDPEQLPLTVTGIIIRPTGVAYVLSYLGEDAQAYDFEMSRERNNNINILGN